MSTTILSLYDNVTNALMENGSFDTIGLMSSSDFLNFLNDIIQDFLSRTGIARKFIGIESLYSINTYTEPNSAMDVQAVFFDNTFLMRSSGYYLDRYSPQWQSNQGVPERWREDETPPKSIEIDPVPVITGRMVTPTPPNPGYGQIAAASNATDFTVLGPASGGYGTISGTSGVLPGGYSGVYVNATNPGYGVISTMVCSNSNIMLVATSQPVHYPSQVLGTYFELLPASAIPYIRWGVLMKIMTGDTEYKDTQRGNFAKQMYELGIGLFSKVMQEQGVN